MSMDAKDILSLTFLIAGALCLVFAFPFTGESKDSLYSFGLRYVFVTCSFIYFYLSFLLWQKSK